MKTKKTNIEKYSLWKASRTDKLTMIVPALFITYMNLILPYYSWNTQLPSKDQIHYTKGTLSYGGNNQSGHHPIITDKNGKKISFSCRFSSGTRHLCSMDEKHLKKSSGKNAEIGWFRQKTSPFSTQKRVLSLNIEGKPIIRSESTKEAIKKIKKNWRIDISIYLVVISLFYFGCRFILKKHHEYQIRINKEQQEKNNNE
jgi:hypothetical protein